MNVWKDGVINRCLARSFVALMLLSGTSIALDYGDLPVNHIPPDGWENITWNDPGGWSTLNVNDYALPANRSDLNATTKIENLIRSTSGNRILYFPRGIYYFTRPQLYSTILANKYERKIVNRNFEFSS